MDYIYGFFIIILDVFCCKIFCETFRAKRAENSIWKTVGIFLGLILYILFSAVFWSGQFLWKVIFNTAITVILMLCYLKITFFQSVILAVLYQSLLLAMDYLAHLVNIWLFQSLSKSLPQIEESSYSQGFLVIMLGKVILFIVVLLIQKYIKRDTAFILTGTEWLRFVFFPVFTIGVVTAMIITSSWVENQEQEMLHFVIASGLVGLNIIVFYLIRDIVKREQKIHEKTITELQMKKQIGIYHSFIENYDKQRRQAHEYQNQMLCIESLLSKKNYSELTEYVTEISGRLGREQNYFQTNNAIVDAILNTKYIETINKNIVFVVKINDLSNLKVLNDDIVVILSNLLNNAIEACEHCRRKKVIKLKFVKDGEAIAISVTNTYENKIIYHEGNIQTTKIGNEGEHGFGIRNIVEAVTKYGGSYIIQTNDHEFCFFIKIMNVCKVGI